MQNTNLNKDTTQKTCTRCGMSKSRDDFYRSMYARSGLYSHCKACHRALLRSKRKRAASERAAGQNQVHATSMPLPRGLGRASLRLATRNPTHKRLARYMLHACHKAGVPLALLAWGVGCPYACVIYLQRVCGLLVSVLGVLQHTLVPGGLLDRSMPHIAVVLSETLQHILNVDALWRYLPNAPPPPPTPMTSPGPGRPTIRSRTAAPPPLTSSADVLAAQLAMQQAILEQQQALQQHAALQLLKSLSGGLDGVAAGVQQPTLSLGGGNESLLLSLCAQQQLQQAQLLGVPSAPPSTQQFPIQPPPTTSAAANADAETLKALAQLKHIPGAHEAVLQFIKTLGQSTPLIPSMLPVPPNAGATQGESGAALAAALAAQSQAALLQQHSLLAPSTTALPGDAMVALPSMQAVPAAMPVPVHSNHLPTDESNGVLLQQFMSMVSPAQISSQGGMEFLLRMLQGGSST